MVELNQSGGIIKEKFDDSKEEEIFQKEEITENDYNMGQILDKKLELNRGDIKTFKPLVGPQPLPAQVTGEPLKKE